MRATCLLTGQKRFGFKHQMAGEPEYKVWAVMLQRCNNPKSAGYPRYGARGIRVVRRWRSFGNFIHDMGRRPGPRYSIDRIDNNGPYSPTNCRWATERQQRANTRNLRLLTFRGRTRHLNEWARLSGIKRDTLIARLDRGWTVRAALTRPVSHIGQHTGRR